MLHNNFSSVPLQMVIYKESGPPDDQIKGTEEYQLLQMIIRMIQPPPCSCIPLQMVICKEDGSPDDQNKGDGGAGIVANDHPEDPASSVPLQIVVCKEDCPSDGQNRWNVGARIVANDYLDDPSSSLLLRSFAKRTVLRKTNIFLVGVIEHLPQLW